MGAGPRLILGSSSSFRRDLLGRLGLPFEVRVSSCKELPIPGLSPMELAVALSEQKARSFVGLEANSILITADQTAEADGQLLRKPTSLDAVREQLSRLQGRTHHLHSAVSVSIADDNRIETEVATATMHMRPLDHSEIDSYVRRDQPIGCVGGYMYERIGIALFERVESADDSTIVGLPLVALCRLLRRVGVDPLSGM